jgi:hypothetical protein
MKTSLRIYSIANAIGAILFFGVVAGICRRAKMEQRDYYDFGDSLTYILHAVPFFLLCLVFNALWGIRGLIDIFRRRRYQASVALGLVVAVWTALFLGCGLNRWPLFSLVSILLSHHGT